MLCDANYMFVESYFGRANSFDSQELAVQYAVFAALWVCWIVVQIIVRIGRFEKEVGGDTVILKPYKSVQESNCFLWSLCGEFDVRRTVVHVGEELF